MIKKTEVRTSFIDGGNRSDDEVFFMEETEVRTSFIDAGNRSEDKFY